MFRKNSQRELGFTVCFVEEAQKQAPPLIGSEQRVRCMDATDEPKHKSKKNVIRRAKITRVTQNSLYVQQKMNENSRGEFLGMRNFKRALFL